MHTTLLLSRVLRRTTKPPLLGGRLLIPSFHSWALGMGPRAPSKYYIQQPYQNTPCDFDDLENYPHDFAHFLHVALKWNSKNYFLLAFSWENSKFGSNRNFQVPKMTIFRHFHVLELISRNQVLGALRNRSAILFSASRGGYRVNFVQFGQKLGEKQAKNCEIFNYLIYDIAEFCHF